MTEWIKAPSGKTLLQLLEERHSLPVGIIKYTSCASCAAPFTPLHPPVAELRVTPEGLREPLLYLCPLCQVCAAKYRRGGRGQRALLAAVGEFLAKEVSQ